MIYVIKYEWYEMFFCYGYRNWEENILVDINNMSSKAMIKEQYKKIQMVLSCEKAYMKNI